MTSKFLRRFLFAFGALVVLGYCGIIVWFTIHESEFVYYPTKSYEATPEVYGLTHESVTIESGDGTQLTGWIIPSPTVDSSVTWILYLHGNSGNVGKTGYLEHYAQLHNLGVNIFSIDYRGYGESNGTPGEAGLYADAEAAYHFLRQVKHVPPDRIVVYGYSLGAAVAIDLATRVEIAGLIVEGAFTSLPNVGQEHYPYLPTQLVTGNRFTSIQKIGRVDAPKLFIHARDDRTVPIHHGKDLFQVATSPKTFLEVKGSHDTAHNVDAVVFYAGIKEFLESILGKAH